MNVVASAACHHLVLTATHLIGQQRLDLSQLYILELIHLPVGSLETTLSKKEKRNIFIRRRTACSQRHLKSQIKRCPSFYLAFLKFTLALWYLCCYKSWTQRAKGLISAPHRWWANANIYQARFNKKSWRPPHLFSPWSQPFVPARNYWTRILTQKCPPPPLSLKRYLFCPPVCTRWEQEVALNYLAVPRSVAHVAHSSRWRL